MLNIQKLNSPEIKTLEQESNAQTKININKIKTSSVLKAKNLYKTIVVSSLQNSQNLTHYLIHLCNQLLVRIEFFIEQSLAHAAVDCIPFLHGDAKYIEIKVLAYQKVIRKHKIDWDMKDKIRERIFNEAKAELSQALKQKIFARSCTDLDQNSEEEKRMEAINEIMCFENKNRQKFYRFYNTYIKWKENFRLSKQLLTYNVTELKCVCKRIPKLMSEHPIPFQTIQKEFLNIKKIRQYVDSHQNSKTLKDAQIKFHSDLEELQSIHVLQQEKIQELANYRSVKINALWDKNSHRLFHLIKIETRLAIQARKANSLIDDSKQCLRMTNEFLFFRQNFESKIQETPLRSTSITR